MPSLAQADVERRAIRVRGAVQGVGFRPFVFRLARDMGLAGWVRNDADGVSIEVEGPALSLASFERLLKTEAPPLARVEHLQATARPPLQLEPGFRIRASRQGRV